MSQNSDKGLEGNLELQEEEQIDIKEITILTSTIIIAFFKLIKVIDRMIERK